MIRFTLFSLCILLNMAVAQEPVSSAMTPGRIEYLVKNKAWSELILRLDEVGPAQRKAGWHAALVAAAVGYLNEAAELKTRKLDLMAEQMVVKFPTLRKSEKFQQARQRAALISVDECYAAPKRRDSCAGIAYDIALRNAKDTRLVRALAVTVSKAQGPAEAASIYLIGARHSKALCGPSGFTASVIEGIARNREIEWDVELKLTRCTAEIPRQLAAAISQRTPAEATRLCEVLRKLDLKSAKSLAACSVKTGP